MPPKNTDPLAPWNSPLYKDNPLAPHNSPLGKNDVFKPWNRPIWNKSDLTKEEKKFYGIRDDARS